jgi:hypothetical protein
MALLPFPPNNISEAIALINQDSQILHEVVHGEDTSESLTDNGLIPSVSKVLKDIQQRILDSLSLDTIVEKKLYSELVGNVFNFTELEYTPTTDPLRSPINVYINGVLTFDFIQSSGTSITLTVVDIDADDEIVVTSNLVNALAINADSAMYVTLEQFDPDAGTGGDDTVAFEQACAASEMSGKLVLLLNKTYLIEPKIFTVTPDYVVSGIVGVKGATIRPFGALKSPASDFILLHIQLIDGAILQNFVCDAQVSSNPSVPNVDPVWDSSNYDTWYGSRGIVVRNSKNYLIDRVTSINAYSAPISEFTPTGSTKINCFSGRGRGNFGDLYYINAAVNCVEINCLAYDGTRIGFVSEAFDGETRLSSGIKRVRCSASYLHDGSINYSGTEFNAGFWDEHSYDVVNDHCHAEDFGNFAYKGSFVTEENKVGSLGGRVLMPYTYKSCTAKNGNIMFQVATQQPEYPVQCIIDDCHGININWRFADLGALAMDSEDRFSVEKSSVILSPVVGSVIQSAVLCYSGEVSVDDLVVRYLGRNLTDYNSTTNASKTISHFSTTSAKKVFVNKLKVYDELGSEIGATICFRNPSNGVELQVSETWLHGIDNRTQSTLYDNCIIHPLSTERHTDFVIRDCKVLSIAGDELNFKTISVFSGQKRVLLDSNLFDLSVWSNYLHLFNVDKVSTSGLVKVKDNKFIWDAEANGYVVRLGADTELKASNNGIYNFEFSGNEFENTGGETSNPIIFSDGSVSNGFTAYGAGNYKSATLLVDGSPTLISNY